MLQFFSIRTNEHISHKESVVGTSANDSNLDPVFFIPSCKAVDDINAISCVQVINSTFSVNSPYLRNAISKVYPQKRDFVNEHVRISGRDDVIRRLPLGRKCGVEKMTRSVDVGAVSRRSTWRVKGR